MPIRRQLLLLVAAALCAAPALPAAPGPTAPSTARPGAVTPASTPTPVPSRAPAAPPPTAAGTVPDAAPAPAARRIPDAQRVAVRVDAAPPDAASRALLVAGVAHVATVHVGRLAVGSGPDELTVATVDPVTYRPFAPPVVAGDPGVWARVAEGELAIMHEHATRLGLPLGGHVVLGGAHGIAVRIGALASNGVPPVAQAIVGRGTGTRLGLDEVPPTLLVAVRDGADPGELAQRLGERLGVAATVVPDPRAVAPAGPAPVQGDTVWDVLAACESSGDWDANTGNGYYGGLQFLPESWRLVGGQGLPHEASREEQVARAERLLAIQGWGAWPECSVRVGLRSPAPS